MVTSKTATLKSINPANLEVLGEVPVMLEDEEDQFALIESSQGGPVTLEVRLLDDDDPSGTKLFESVVLK